MYDCNQVLYVRSGQGYDSYCVAKPPCGNDSCTCPYKARDYGTKVKRPRGSCSTCNNIFNNTNRVSCFIFLALFPSPHLINKHQFYGVTRGFTRSSLQGYMKTKYVFHVLFFLFPPPSTTINFMVFYKVKYKDQMWALFQFPPFKLPSFMVILRVVTAKCVMLRC